MLFKSLFYAALIGMGSVVGCSTTHSPPEFCLGTTGTDEHIPEKKTGPASRDAMETGRDITLQDALALALSGNPQLAAYSQAMRAAEARRLQAGRWHNPELEVEVEDFGGDRHGINEAATTVMLGQLFELGGKRSKRVHIHSLEKDMTDLDYQSKKLHVLTGVAAAFVDVLGRQRALALTAETVKIAEAVKSAISARVIAGSAAPVEEIIASTTLAKTRTDFKRAQDALNAARMHLAGMWNSREPRFARALGDLDIELKLPPLAELKKKLSKNPEVLRANMIMLRQNARVDLEKAKRYPNITLRAGYRYIGEDNANTMVASIALPLPIFNWNKGGINEAESELNKALWQKRALEQNLHAMLAKEYAALKTLADQGRSFKKEILPGALSAYNTIQQGYQDGKFNYTDLLNAQQALAETRLQQIDVLVALHAGQARLECLTGQLLFPWIDRNKVEIAP